MSRNSQQKRAARAKTRAKQRARQGAESRAGASSAGWHGPGGWDYPSDWDYPSSWDHPGARQEPGGRDGLGGSNGSFGSPFTQQAASADDVLGWAQQGMLYPLWVEQARAVGAQAVAEHAEVVLPQWLKVAYGAGWQPTELIRESGRFAKSGGTELLRGAIAAERATREGPTASDAAWLRQWRAAGAADWAPPAGWLSAQAATVDGWLKNLHRLAWMLGQLPVLDPLLPAPPGVTHLKTGPSYTAPAASNPLLDKVRALLAKAESTEYESEAMLLTAKAQELMTKHALEEAMLVGSPGGDGMPNMIRLPIDAPYANIKALLLQTIAEQSRCRTMLLSSLDLSTVIGYPSDLQAVEVLFTSLLLQAQHALAEAGAAAPPGSRVRSQAFRSAFLSGFTGRIGARLAEVNAKAFEENKEDAGRFLPVLRAREERIGEFMAEHFEHSINKYVRGGSDPLGYRHGMAAADQATLISGALED